MPSQKKQKADKQIVYSGQEKDVTIKSHLTKKISLATIAFSIVHIFWKILGTIRLVLQKKQKHSGKLSLPNISLLHLHSLYTERINKTLPRKLMALPAPLHVCTARLQEVTDYNHCHHVRRTRSPGTTVGCLHTCRLVCLEVRAHSTSAVFWTTPTAHRLLIILDNHYGPEPVWGFLIGK